ncbi:hypothetical protein [Thiocapsa bogorovii]|uniref:hypothetical protein n=1 Tax=Thiocapsa bogorovii TaxID=521689 RepID=UPI001E31FAE4|nr:hypothetical protein [Thiocapsa bogorovii]UHD16575.1 hypothetical protein LT988_00470 [Thiocapsa bogorovii]
MRLIPENGAKMRCRRRRSICTASVAVALVVVGGTPSLAEPVRIDPQTGAATFETQAHGVFVSLTQLLPDQVRAFYVARGFDLADANVFAEACVYMTVLRNDAAPGELDFRLADWEVRYEGETRSLAPLEDWLTQWSTRGVPDSAKLAFRWAQFPAEQSYAPGEWNQGMLATGLPPGSRFDLVARWTIADQSYEGTLDDVRCTD